MTPRHARTSVLVVVLIVAVVAAAWAVWTRFDRANFGLPGFAVWRAVSGEAHGGRRAAIDGVNIYYETYGSGPPVLVLHGGLAALETMHYQISDLAADHLMIAPDSRGHGRSTDAPGPLHYDQMADDMVALLDRLHIARADVVGWSDGGIIGLDLALRHPERVRRLVTIGANFDVAGLVDPHPTALSGPMIATLGDFYRRISPTPDHWPVFYDKVTSMWAREPHFAPADLARIGAPVLVIAGEHDAIRREHTDALARAIPGARELIVAGADHTAPLTAAKPVDAAIRAFLTPSPAGH